MTKKVVHNFSTRLCTILLFCLTYRTCALSNRLIQNMKGTIRAHIKSGIRVKIVLKKDQRSGILTEGIVKDILTNSPTHHHGIKVRLSDGQVGRVKEIPEGDEDNS